MKRLLILLILLAGCISDEPFCGTSTHEPCETIEDCTTAGCSSQICQSKSQEMGFTTCEFRACYEANIYDIECTCYNKECQWR
jgi:eight-cysteine-cluster-containing protein